MFDEILDALTWIDPVKWIDDAITSSGNAGGWLLEWQAGAVTGADVENILRAHGIKVYARRYPTRRNPIAGCHVPEVQAKWADGILRGYGIPVISAQLSAPIRPRRTWGVPAKPQGFAGWVGQALGITGHIGRRPR